MSQPMDRSWYAVPVAVVVAAAVALGAPVPPDAATMLAITAFSIVLWIGNPLPAWFVGLLTIGSVGVAFSPSLAFTGFQSPATWLIGFGLIVGEATRQSGLGAFFEARLLSWISADEGHDTVDLYRRLLVGLSLAGLAFTLLLPSALVRVLVLAPILADIGTLFDSRRARVGLFVGPLFVTWHAAGGVLTAALPNIITTGILESVAGQTISWSAWLLAMFPVTSLARAALIVTVVYVLYRPAPDSGIDPPTGDDRAATGTERRMLLLLFVGVAVWATDFLHGLHPVFGALLVAGLAIAPRIGVMEFESVADVDFSLLFFVGSVFAIASGLQQTGFTDTAAGSLLALLPSDLPLWLAMLAVFAVTSLLMVLIEAVALASVITPVVISYAEQASLPVVPVILAEALALDTSYFFPYQSMVLVTILGFDVIDANELVRTMSVVAILSIVLLLLPQVLLLLLLY
ncbi:sodium:sulfate symporter [Halobellus sp. Atlit-31R]|nr:sodium:sulfate symporter [Halobellus sp. Atlit-31R]